MKCRECDDFLECSKKRDLRRYRSRCPKAKKEKVKTNGDHIRSMNDDELAAFLNGFNICDRRSSEDCKYVYLADCYQCVMHWLQETVNEE